MHALRRLVPLIALIPAVASAEKGFDGSAPLICASHYVMDLTSPTSVVSGLPGEMGAPEFMRLDFQKKTITGAQKTTRILNMTKDNERILLQGTEEGMAWTLALSEADGAMIGSLVDEGGAVVIFGSCVPL